MASELQHAAAVKSTCARLVAGYGLVLVLLAACGARTLIETEEQPPGAETQGDAGAPDAREGGYLIDVPRRPLR